MKNLVLKHGRREINNLSLILCYKTHQQITYIISYNKHDNKYIHKYNI